MSEAQNCMLASGVVTLLLLWFTFVEDNPVTANLLGLWSGPQGQWMTQFLLKKEISILRYTLHLHDILPSLSVFTNFFPM